MVTHVVVVYLDVFRAAHGSRQDQHSLLTSRVRENWGRSHLGEAELPQEVSDKYAFSSTAGRCAYSASGVDRAVVEIL